MKTLLAAALAALSLTVAAAAAPSNDPLSFYLSEQRIFSPVDLETWCGDCIGADYTTQEPWAANPGSFWPYDDLAAAFVPPASHYSAGERGCLWDSDDSFTLLSQGNVLAAGATVTVEKCIYLHYGWRPNDIYIVSPSPDLDVSVTWTTDQATFTHRLTPTFDTSQRLWRYFECLYTPQLAGTLVPIPDSHGSAIPTRIRYTIGNPTRQKVGKTGGALDYGNQPGITRGPGCVNAGGWHFP